MNTNNILVSLLVSAVLLFLLLNLKNNNKHKHLVFVLIFIIAILYTIYLVIVYNKSNNKIQKTNKENFYSAPIGYKMSDTDGLNSDDLATTSFDNLEIHQLPNIDNVLHISPIGGESKLNLPNDTNKPTVDGRESSPRSLFMFSYNKSNVECCDSQYSNSMGCICLTDEQKNVLRRA
jgi:hypothetical protein